MARPSSGSGLTIAQLQQILNQRRTELNKLYKKRTDAERDLAAIEKQIAKLEGEGSSRGMGRGSGVRARNDKSLVETLEEVLGGVKGPLGVKEIVDGVEKAGYRSNSANFRGLVNQTLIKEAKRFASAGRGLYEMKKKAS